MIVRKSDDFISDLERQFQWYADNASWEVAESYLTSVQAACRLLEQYPLLGPCAGFTHQRLREWRFFVVFRPFNSHLIFYELIGGDLVLRRTMHGRRDLPERLLEPPSQS